LTSKLKDLSVEWADIPMLARTRTTRLSYPFSKEIGFFVERLEEQMRLLFNIPLLNLVVLQEITMHIMWLIHNRLEKIWRNLC
jgi:hypothetical protein